MSKIYEFIHATLSPTGDISFGRAASGASLTFCLGWDTAFVWFAMKHLDFAHMTIHDVLPSPGALAAQAAFCAAFYTINKVKAASDVMQQTKNNTPPAQ